MQNVEDILGGLFLVGLWAWSGGVFHLWDVGEGLGRAQPCGMSGVVWGSLPHGTLGKVWGGSTLQDPHPGMI